MNNKICPILVVCLLIISVYVVWENKTISDSYNNLSHSWTDLNKSYSDLREARWEAIYGQTLLMPKGLDEHYERIRNYESYKFTGKGDPGYLVFYATQVLHDLGAYNYTQRCIEFDNKVEIPCRNLTVRFAKDFLEYINESFTFTGHLNSNMTKLQIMYEWMNDFVFYVNDTNDFGRFPIETLTCRFGDCEDQAMALSFLLESSGYETALCIIHDKNLTQYDSEGLHHVFCAVKKDSLEYNGTLIQLNEYEEYGNSWLVLDPAFNPPFGSDPEWMNYYRDENGTISIPSELWSSLGVDYNEVINRAREIGISP